MEKSTKSENNDRDLQYELMLSYAKSNTEVWGHAFRNPAETTSMLSKFWASQFNALAGLSKLRQDPKRFRDDGWDAPYFGALQDCWLRLEEVCGEWLDNTCDNPDIHHRRRQYMLALLLEAISPRNYALSHPEGWRTTEKERGQNLIKGMSHLLEDLSQNNGLPNKVEPDAFELGKDIATTEGTVVHRDEFCELIQYKPVTGKVRSKPILIVYSVINRFYLLDTTQRRSVVRFLLDQGYQVFVQSWRNPRLGEDDWSLEDYVGAVENAFDVVREIAGTETLNMMGICAGAYPAYAALHHRQTQGDRAVDGMVALVSAIDNQLQDTLFGLIGTADTTEMAKTLARTSGGLKSDDLNWSFSLLQPDRLIFPYFFEAYALGERRVPNEIAYWLQDQVNIPTRFYEELIDYITQNSFVDPEKTSIKGVPLKLDEIDTDLLIVSAQFDDIMPWKAAYRTLDHVTCPVDFVLTNGGHITPMTADLADKRPGYWHNPHIQDGASADEWQSSANWHQQSWLHHLNGWLETRSGELTSPPVTLGSKRSPELGPAPGTYVRS